jgi:hypothetical protein
VPCFEIPPFGPFPPLPPGVSIPIFPGLVLPSIGLCCKIQLPPWGAFPIPMVTLPIAFPAAVITAYAEIVAAVQALTDSLSIPCPSE